MMKGISMKTKAILMILVSQIFLTSFLQAQKKCRYFLIRNRSLKRKHPEEMIPAIVEVVKSTRNAVWIRMDSFAELSPPHSLSSSIGRVYAMRCLTACSRTDTKHSYEPNEACSCLLYRITRTV